MLSLRFDMHAPALGAASIDMCAWADWRSPHRALPLNVVVVLPLQDPVRLAEDKAVLDIISAGRMSHTLDLGYRSEEFGQFGREFAERGQVADAYAAACREQGVTLLRRSCRTAIPRRCVSSPTTSIAPGRNWARTYSTT